LNVFLYAGGLSLVKRSGVAEAVVHQKEMLSSIDIQTVCKWSQPSDVVHLNTIFPDSLLASYRARQRKKKIVYYGHSTMEDFRNSFKGSNFFAPLFRRWIIRCYNSGDVIITPTEYSKGLLESYGIKKPIYSLSNGIDTDFFAPNEERRKAFRAEYKLNEREKAVISVGHYIERKGLPDFVELARRMPDVRFFWFGYTDLKLVPNNIREAIESAPPNLCFPGYVDRNELRDAYCGCDLFAFMTKEETEGIVVLEALACGIPAIVSDIPVYDGWLKDGVNIYKAKGLDDFAKKTEAILTGYLPDLTAQGREVAEERSLQSTGLKLKEIYEKEHILNQQSVPKRYGRRTEYWAEQNAAKKMQNDLSLTQII